MFTEGRIAATERAQRSPSAEGSGGISNEELSEGEKGKKGKKGRSGQSLRRIQRKSGMRRQKKTRRR